MKILNHPHFSLIFCDKQNSFARNQFYNLQTSQELLQQPQFEFLPQKNGPQMLITADQIHKTDGLIITSLEQALAYKPYSTQADFIVTNVPQVALGIATADCLPIIFYDAKNNALGVAHAGWPGTVAGIAIKTVQAMQQNFGSNPQDLQIFFGPCASVQMYEVGSDFCEKIQPLESFDTISHICSKSLRTSGEKNSARGECFASVPTQQNVSNHSSGKSEADKTFIQKNGKHFFNIPLYNQLLLEAHGVPKTAFVWDYFQCTIANNNFCSYRRDKDDQRQMTIAWLLR